MNDPIATFPNETYLNGLRNADSSVVDALYNEFRLPITRAVASLGGNYADGNTFFRVAVIQTAGLLQAGQYPEETPIYLFLKNLALAQFRDWLDEKGQELPQLPEPSAEEIAVISQMPSEAAMRYTRLEIRAKRLFNKLTIEDQRQILGLANRQTAANSEVQNTVSGSESASLGRYKNLFNEKGENWENGLPICAVTALTDTHFHQTWTACENLEKRLNAGQIPVSNENKTIRNAFLVFVLLTLGYALYTWFSRDRSPTQVYENNFQPPASIMDDLAARYSKDSIAHNRPEACTIAFSEADAYYKKRAWRDAANALIVMADDSLAVCQSDAYFYLAIVGLHLENPELTLQCIAKIEDLDRFGEDIYWYMALAYVKMAAIDPSEKDIARRAVQRALSNTELPERRIQAEKMLEELAE